MPMAGSSTNGKTRTDRVHDKMKPKPGEKGKLRPVPVMDNYSPVTTAGYPSTSVPDSPMVAPGGSN